jgi:hypothetical protein
MLVLCQVSMGQRIKHSWLAQRKDNSQDTTKALRVIIKNIENSKLLVLIEELENKAKKAITMTSFQIQISLKKSSECFMELSPPLTIMPPLFIIICNKTKSRNKKVSQMLE